MKIGVGAIVLCLIFGGVVVLNQALRIFWRTRVSYTMQPFERQLPNARLNVLFVGDSTAVGTGAATNRESTAGWLAKDFPDAQITNHSRNGKRLRELVEDFQPTPDEHYDLIVMQIGANDIMKFTSYKGIERDLSIVVARAKSAAKNVVILHSGNVGLAPVFVWPFDVLLAKRSRDVRAIYRREAQKSGALYVDLYSERDNDLFLKDIKYYYSSDFLHPAGPGYQFWYSRIRQTLQDAHVNL